MSDWAKQTVSKRLILVDEAIGVKVYVDATNSFWVQFIGATKWGRKLYRPSALDLSVTSEGASVTRLVVQE